MAVFMKRDKGLWEPLSYTPLKALKTTGTQCINTNYYPKYNTRVVMKISDVPTNNQFLLGTRKTASATAEDQFCIFRRNDGTIRSDYFGGNATGDLTDATPETIIDKNKNVTTMYGMTLTSAAKTSGQSTNPLYLLALNTAGKVNNFCTCKLYYCQIYEDDVLLHYYIPVIDNNNVVCIYDKIEQIYLYNAGTGAFVGVAL